jgi:hypothetical protein
LWLASLDIKTTKSTTRAIIENWIDGNLAVRHPKQKINFMDFKFKYNFG